jgi:hypothetical protein
MAGRPVVSVLPQSRTNESLPLSSLTTPATKTGSIRQKLGQGDLDNSIPPTQYPGNDDLNSVQGLEVASECHSLGILGISVAIRPCQFAICSIREVRNLVH